MTPRFVFTRSLFAAVILALPFAEGGCGRTACFTWSSKEGACPAQSEALGFFSDPRCPGRVASVDGPPITELDGTLCCYEVTQRSQSEEGTCLGAGGFRSSSGEESVAAVGVGGFGGSEGSGVDAGACLHCNATLGSLSSPPLCSGSQELFLAFINCACGSTCSSACANSFCSGAPPDMSCGDCLGLVSSEGCGNELTACANDL